MKPLSGISKNIFRLRPDKIGIPRSPFRERIRRCPDMCRGKGLLTFFVFRNTLLLLFLTSAMCLKAQSPKLSDQAEISVLTLGPFQGEVYSAFGHSAIRVYDPNLGIDDAYNWGEFDFDQPNFYLNFARGRNNYKLGVYPYDRFRDHYIYYNRYVHEQKLNLSVHQKQRLYEYVQWNALPENKSYRYDYFYDNCATKIRDVMVTVFGDSVKFDGSYIKTEYSIRDLTDLYLKHQPWGDLGIDLGLGLPIDKKATPYEYMFLPDYIESAFDHASLNNTPIVKKKISVYESREEDYPKSLFHPLTAFILVTVIALLISVWDVKRKKLSTWFDVLLFGTVGFVGMALFLMWVATDHKASANNFNLLWALPTHLVAVIAFIKNPKWLKRYFLITAVISAFTLLLWPVLPQKLNYFLVPLVMALCLRALMQYRLRIS